MCLFYSLIRQLLFYISASSVERSRSEMWAVPTQSLPLLKFKVGSGPLVISPLRLTFYQLDNLHVVWARHQSPVNLKTAGNNWRKQRRSRARKSLKTTESHLNDPISRLDSSSHRRSIYDTDHRGGVTPAWGKGQKPAWVSLTFFDQLHKDGIVSAHSQPKTIFIPLDYHTALDETWTHTNTHLRVCLWRDTRPVHTQKNLQLPADVFFILTTVAILYNDF